MSEQVEEQVCILFKINRCRGLRGNKTNQFVVAIKVEFGDTILGESGKYDGDSESNSLMLDFICQMNIPVNEALIFNEIAQTPVVLTFSEILPKDKKAREEKTVVIGQTCIDLLPLLKGENIFTVIESIHPLSGIYDSSHPLPEVEVEISTPKPLLAEEKLDHSNLLTICVESIYSLPEAWTLNGHSFHYSACIPIPTEENESNILIPNGLFRAGGEKEVSMQRKWSCVPNASGTCLFLPDTEILLSSYEDEDGDLKDPEDVNFRDEAENTKSRVTWNAEGRCFMLSKAISNLQQKIAQYRYWPVEIIRTCVSNGKLKNKEDESPLSYHGIVYIDLAPLLYPGVNKIRGAFYVQPFNENDLLEKLKRKSCLDEKVMRRLMGSNISINQLTNVKAAGGKQTRTETRGKQSEGNLKGDLVYDADLFEIATQESHEYLEARTYMTLEIELEKPFVEKRQPEAVVLRLAELIPPRTPHRMKQCGSKKAVEDFEKQIFNTANIILEEFRTMFGSKLSADGDDAEERRKAFLYELNQSGKYFAFKEQLKYYVIKLVREKFMYTSSFESREKLQEFISKLYQFLIDRMHVGLNKYLSAEETTEVPPQIADSALLKHFAKEAEIMFRYDLAAKYYQERIVRHKTDAECWFDYGIFCLLVDDVQKAEECFKEVVSLDQQHLNGILLTGLMYFQHQEYSITEELFDGVTCIHPKEILPWTLLGLFYSGVENIIMAERSFNLASKLMISKTATEKVVEKVQSGVSDEVNHVEENEEEELEEVSKQMDNISVSEKETEEKEVEHIEHPSIFLYTAKFLLDCHVLQMAERALAHELVGKTHGSKVLYLELMAQLKMKQKDYLSALESLEEALAISHENQGVWALKGHIYYEMCDFNAAKQAYERCLAYCTDAPNIHSIYLRLATVYLEQDLQYESAKNIFLKLCKSSPSCVTWLGMGVACYRLNQLFDAEQAFNEANILDNRNPDVWTYLSMVCLKENRHLEAEQCYKYAIKVGPSTKSLMDEIMEVMAETNFDTSVL